jgi:predicted  nucleic acid-binding Zn-ribbon protein
MSIKAIARDMYKARQKVDKLEREMENASFKEQDALRGELRIAQKELNMLRKILDGEKESSSFRKKFQGFGQ